MFDNKQQIKKISLSNVNYLMTIMDMGVTLNLTDPKCLMYNVNVWYYRNMFILNII